MTGDEAKFVQSVESGHLQHAVAVAPLLTTSSTPMPETVTALLDLNPNSTFAQGAARIMHRLNHRQRGVL